MLPLTAPVGPRSTTTSSSVAACRQRSMPCTLSRTPGSPLMFRCASCSAPRRGACKSAALLSPAVLELTCPLGLLIARRGVRLPRPRASPALAPLPRSASTPSSPSSWGSSNSSSPTSARTTPGRPWLTLAAPQGPSLPGRLPYALEMNCLAPARPPKLGLALPAGCAPSRCCAPLRLVLSACAVPCRVPPRAPRGPQ